MKTKNKIFDLSNTSDLPEKLFNELTCNKEKGTFIRNIIYLLGLSEGGLHLDEIQVGYFREFGIYIQRHILVQRLYNSAKKEGSSIYSAKGRKGIYGLTSKGK